MYYYANQNAPLGHGGCRHSNCFKVDLCAKDAEGPHCRGQDEGPLHFRFKETLRAAHTESSMMGACAVCLLNIATEELGHGISALSLTEMRNKVIALPVLYKWNVGVISWFRSVLVF